MQTRARLQPFFPAPLFVLCSILCVPHLYCVVSDQCNFLVHALSKVAPIAGFLYCIIFIGQAECVKPQNCLKATPYAATLSLGFVFCMLGDLSLAAEKYLLPEFFVVGLAFFLIGHLLFIRAYNLEKPEYAPVAGAVWYTFGIVMCVYLMPTTPSDLRLPVIIYTMVISTMGYRAFARLGSEKSSSSSQLVGALGAAVFTISDSLIALNKFKFPIPFATLWVMITYYLAQALIAASAFEASKVVKRQE